MSRCIAVRPFWSLARTELSQPNDEAVPGEASPRRRILLSSSTLSWSKGSDEQVRRRSERGRWWRGGGNLSSSLERPRKGGGGGVFGPLKPPSRQNSRSGLEDCISVEQEEALNLHIESF